jgi:hypothetical protein
LRPHCRRAHRPHPFLAGRTRPPSPRVLARFPHRDAGRRWPVGRMRGKVHDNVRDKVRRKAWTRLNTFQPCGLRTLNGLAPHPPCRAPSPRASIANDGRARGEGERAACAEEGGSVLRPHGRHPFLAGRTRPPSPRVLARRMRGKVHDKVHDKVPRFCKTLILPSSVATRAAKSKPGEISITPFSPRLRTPGLTASPGTLKSCGYDGLFDRCDRHRAHGTGGLR